LEGTNLEKARGRIRIRIEVKSWIRIRTKLIRIRNKAQNTAISLFSFFVNFKNFIIRTM